MSTVDVIMPQLGESIAEGTVVRWLKKIGESVGLDEPLFEISTDKVDAEIPSPCAGILSKILVGESATVPINTVVAVIDKNKTAGDGSHQASSGSLMQARAELTPAITELPPSAPKTGEPGTSSLPSSEGTSAGEVLSSPLVRRIARENHIDLALVRGTGTDGRVRKQDVFDYLEQNARNRNTERRASLTQADEKPALSAPANGELVFSESTLVVPMTPMRKQIAEHMIASRRTSAHVTTVFEVEMTTIVQIRQRQAEQIERQYGVKLTYTAFFVRAVALILRDFPIFNSSVENTNIVYRRDINIGVAVALSNGLIVPVIKSANEKSLLGLARAIQDVAERARSKRLRLEDVQDGTFTITNPGIFGSLFGSPIINQPQVAILAVGTVQERPVVREGAIAIRPMVYLSLSYDHRVIDGETGARFLGRLKAVLENWKESAL